MYRVLNVNWSTFLKGILLTLQGHGWNNGTCGGHQLGSGDLYLLPLTMWRTGVSLATVWASWLLMGVPNDGFCHLQPHPTLPCCLSHAPTPLLSILMAERDGKKYLEIQPLEIEVSYNKIIKYFAAQHVGTIQGRGLVFVTEYFKMVFLEIPLGANKAGFCLEGPIFYMQL